MAKGPGLLRFARLTRRQLVAFTLVSAAVNGMVTASVGAWLAQTYSSHQARRQSIDTISKLLYERRTRAGMVASAIRRNADLEEVRERKRAYDDAYVAWNTQALRHLFVIRDVMGDGGAGQVDIEQEFQDVLVGSLADIDRCITKAYDARVKGGDGVVVMTACNMNETYQFVLDCGASFLNEMDKLTRLSFLPFSDEGAKGKAKAEARIRKGCARAADAPDAASSPEPAAAPPSSETPAAPSAAVPPPGPEGAPAEPAPELPQHAN